MSIREQRSSPSTIEFKYSLSPTPSPSLPNISTVIDGIASALKSALYLLIAQLSAAHLKTNRMLGPVLRNIGQIFPYNDIRIVRPTDASWELSPFGTILNLLPLVNASYSMVTVEESFLIVRSLGVQTTTRMRFPLAGHSRFIPATQIDDVLLYEGFKGLEVRYYLAVVVHGEDRVEVVFPKLLPRREVLEQVWRSARDVLSKVDH